MLTLKGLPCPSLEALCQYFPNQTNIDMSLLVKTAGICLYSDFHDGLLKHIRVQKKILLKNILHKNLPGVLDPAVYPSRNLFPQST